MADAEHRSPDEQERADDGAPLELEPPRTPPPSAEQPIEQTGRAAPEEPTASGTAGEREAPPDWDRGYSLAQLFVLLVVVSALLAVLRMFSPQIAAGVAGLVVLAGLVFMSLTDPPAIIRLAWWVLLGVYLLAAAFAVARG